MAPSPNLSELPQEAAAGDNVPPGSNTRCGLANQWSDSPAHTPCIAHTHDGMRRCGCHGLASFAGLQCVLRRIGCTPGCRSRSWSCCAQMQRHGVQCHRLVCCAACVLCSATLVGLPGDTEVRLQWHRAVACAQPYHVCACVLVPNSPSWLFSCGRRGCGNACVRSLHHGSCEPEPEHHPRTAVMLPQLPTQCTGRLLCVCHD